METAIQAAAPPAKPTPVRSRRRWYILGTIALVLIAVPVGYYLYATWMRDRELEQLYAQIDAEDPNWRWRDLIAELEPAPADQNAFTQMSKVHKLLKTTPFTIAPIWDSEAKQKSLLVRNARLSDDNALILRSAFKPLDPRTLPEARKLKSFPKGRMKIDPEVQYFNILLTEIQNSRAILHLLQSDIILRMHDNDLDGAVESWHALLNTSHAIEDNPTFIGQLVRMAGQAIALGAFERMLAQGEFSEADLATIQSLLKREVDDNLLYFGLRGERGGSHHMFLEVRDGKTTITDLMGGIKGGGGPGPIERALDLFPSVILKGYPEHLRLFDELVKASKLKEEERMDAMQKIEQKIRGSRSIIARLMMPASMKVTEASQRVQAQLRTAMVAVAVERYHVKHDAWPQGFDDLLKDGLLAAVPNDPWDGKSLRFKRTPTGVLIYSVGMDKIDNQGTFDRRNPTAAGSDIGFELWDRQLRAVQPPVEEEVQP